MPKEQTVQSGDCLSSIAYENGHFAETVWNDPANTSLREQRKNMNLLVPGDTVTIPDKRLREEAVNTGAEHRFRRRGVPAQLRLQVLDLDQPVANQRFTIAIDDSAPITGSTNAEGRLAVPIPPNAQRAVLTVGEAGGAQLEYELALGHLQPAETIAGVQARLNNLGFECGGEEGAVGPQTEEALKAFQGQNDLPVTGRLDDATRTKLVELHDKP